MDSKFIRAKDGRVWMDVTDKAKVIFEHDIFQLYHVWESDGEILRIPIIDDVDLSYAIETAHPICIEIGSPDGGHEIGKVTFASWAGADSIIHNGFVYVRYSDLTFCK